MIRLSRQDLLEIASIYMMANTAPSLFKAMCASDAVNRMRTDAWPNELIEYYDKLTTRAKRDEIIIGLAYGVLIALLLNTHNTGPRSVSHASSLHWGTQIEELARSIKSTQHFRIELDHESRIEIKNKPAGIIILPDQATSHSSSTRKPNS